MANNELAGACLCEGVKFKVTGSPAGTVICYCRDCQLGAGGPGQMIAKFARSQVETLQGEELKGMWVVRSTSSGDPKEKYFCKQCGCTLWTRPTHGDGQNYMVRVPLILQGFELLKPQRELFSQERPSYMQSLVQAPASE